MFELKIFKSSGNAAFFLLSTHFYSQRDIAIANAIKCVPQDVRLNWIQGKHEDDVIFSFFYGSAVFQFAVTQVVADQAVPNWSEHEVVFPGLIIENTSLSFVASVLKNE